MDFNKQLNALAKAARKSLNHPVGQQAWISAIQELMPLLRQYLEQRLNHKHASSAAREGHPHMQKALRAGDQGERSTHLKNAMKVYEVNAENATYAAFYANFSLGLACAQTGEQAKGRAFLKTAYKIGEAWLENKHANVRANPEWDMQMEIAHTLDGIGPGL